MEIGSAFSSGLQGFQRASQGVTDASLNINRQTTEQRTLAEEPQQVQAQQEPPPPPEQTQSLETSIVNLTSELGNARANARTLETADEVVGSIIDIRV